MKVEYPGLIKEKMASGNVRYRVRVEGTPSKRIKLHVKPGDKPFEECYHAARAGIEIQPEQEVSNAVYGSLKWLGEKYIAELERQVETDQLAPRTLGKKKGSFKTLQSLVEGLEKKTMLIPQEEIINLQKRMAKTPAAADTLVSFLKTMFDWAMQERLISANPAAGVGKIDKGKGGSKPWTVDDLKAFRDFHRPGSTAHLCLTILMFTACRISDAAVMGREHEFSDGAVRWIGWQPMKRGSAFVEVPMLPPLIKAIDKTDRFRRTYLLNEYGRPFASGSSLSARFKKWCQQAGLPDRSAHGVRKAAGHLLALEGCTQYQIMAVHGHTQAQTSEIYTKGVERRKLAREAMATLADMEW